MNTPSAPTSHPAPQGGIGVIYAPRPGGKRHWRRALHALQRSGVPFDYLRAESNADVQRIAVLMTQRGYGRIIVAGGDSALSYALGGIIATTQQGVAPADLPALGVIPLGFGNDFARYWGLDLRHIDAAVAVALGARQRRIDVGRAHYTEAGEADKGGHTVFFLNCINVGVAAAIVGLRRRAFSLLGSRRLAYVASIFLLLFRRMSYALTLTFPGERVTQRAMTLCAGSARGYGLTPGAVPYNGVLDVTAASAPRLSGLAHGLWLLLSGRILNHNAVRVWRTRRLTLELPQAGAPVSLDGRFLTQRARHITVDILPEAIQFIIP